MNPPKSPLKSRSVIECLETLHTIQLAGTMTAAAERLRLTQGTISKRVQQLERQYGEALVERIGRRVQLTRAAERLLVRALPHLLGLEQLVEQPPEACNLRYLSLAISESILASWGARTLRETLERFPELKLELHTHRSPVVVAGVSSGRYQLGIAAGRYSATESLSVDPLGHEALSVVGKLPDPLPKRAPLRVLSIERNSGTGQAIKTQLEAAVPALEIERELESFGAITQLALSGFALGLVPSGLAATYRIPARKRLDTDIVRPIVAVSRRGTGTDAALREFIDEFGRRAMSVLTDAKKPQRSE